MHKNIIDLIKSVTGIALPTVKNVVEMLQEGMTVPFISRYRKEKTNSLDDLGVQSIKDQLKYFEELIQRKESILKAIDEQGELTPALKDKINNCWNATELEDIYLPYKKKRKTRAEKARKAGLEPLAKLIMSQNGERIRSSAKRFISNEITTIDDAIHGAQDIIAEWINENMTIRKRLRSEYQRNAILSSKVIKSKKTEAELYQNYFDHDENINRAPSHRVLAIFRGEKEGLLRVKVGIDQEKSLDTVGNNLLKSYSGESHDLIVEASEDALKRLLLPSLESESKAQAKERADEEAIQVFGKNLEDLLMAAPLGSQWILGLDPGFRSGCKLVVIDSYGSLKDKTNVYPHAPQNSKTEAEMTIFDLLEAHPITAIAIGNGTAGKESYQWLKSILKDKDIEIFFINENGASIYSASAVARKEFPNEDVTVRGAVSIARRLMDPMAELIKIDPKSIGVGQYQHDVHQGKLKEKLAQTLETCVNKVGVNLNTASAELLEHIAGLGPTIAQNIIAHRDSEGSFKKRSDLKKVKRLGNKAYEQAAGFLRIKGASQPLDNTGVHPERYKLVETIAKDQKISIDDLINNIEVLNAVSWKSYASEDAGMPTLLDIKEELSKPGLDPRGKAKEIEFQQSLNSIDDLRAGMIIKGAVSNITKFGAFIDIGIKENGLVHVSEIANRYIKDPAELLKINQEVRVKVLDIDLHRKRIALSIKQTVEG